MCALIYCFYFKVKETQIEFQTLATNTGNASFLAKRQRYNQDFFSFDCYLNKYKVETDADTCNEN